MTAKNKRIIGYIGLSIPMVGLFAFLTLLIGFWITLGIFSTAYFGTLWIGFFVTMSLAKDKC